MTAEEDRLIAFLVGETDRAPKPDVYRVPHFKQRRPRKNRAKRKQVSWSATGRKSPP
jgi:hypothetical protein